VNLNRAYKDGYFDDYFANDAAIRELARERIHSTVYSASFRGTGGSFRLERIASRSGQIHLEPIVDDKPRRIALTKQTLRHASLRKEDEMM
jgi:hypothetical protein